MNELVYTFKQHPHSALQTIYVGGGTPSLIKPELYSIMFDKIKEYSTVEKTAEVTIEVNPATIDLDYLKAIKKIGFNRISIGVQCFDDKILKIINRKHNVIDALKAVEMAKETGFDNISIDLIYGLPSQKMEDWAETLNIAMKLDIQHISTYGLKIEEDTYFAKKTPANLPDEDLAVEMYLKAIEIFEENGFQHYEISNFAKSGFESNHNKNYWQNNEYFGFGLAAHGYIDGVRYANSSNFEEYLKNPCEKESENELSKQDIMEESIFLGLRLKEGIDIQDFNEKYNVEFLDIYKKIIEKYVDLGLLVLENSKLKLTKEGILVSNVVMADFLT